VHCHNCPVHATAALALLDREPPAGTHASWTAHFAEPLTMAAGDREPLFVFRVGAHWLAMPAPIVVEVAPERTVHSLPHRRRGAVLGVVNVHGALVMCLSIGAVIGLDMASAPAIPRAFVRDRMLLIRHGDLRAACPVDEVSGIHRVELGALVETPAAVAEARSCITRVWNWRDSTVGVLDDGRFGQALRRSVA
jgi:chemotaxis-related protein WspD